MESLITWTLRTSLPLSGFDKLPFDKTLIACQFSSENSRIVKLGGSFHSEPSQVELAVVFLLIDKLLANVLVETPPLSKLEIRDLRK